MDQQQGNGRIPLSIEVIDAAGTRNNLNGLTREIVNIEGGSPPSACRVLITGELLSRIELGPVKLIEPAGRLLEKRALSEIFALGTAPEISRT